MLSFFFRNRSRLFLLSVLLLCLWALIFRSSHRSQPKGALRNFSLSLWMPVQKAVNGLLAFPEETLSAIRELRHLREETNRLQLENQSLRLELSNHKSVEAELERLKSVLQIKPRFPQKAKIARIVAHDPSTWNKSFIVDAGSQDGVSADSPVVSEQGIVGRVLEATRGNSRVLMVTDLDSSVAGIDMRSRVTGIIQGTGRNQLKFAFVAPGEDVQPGDSIVSSGMGGVFPKGYALGTVLKKRPLENGLAMDIEVAPAVDFGVLDYVFILPPEGLYP